MNKKNILFPVVCVLMATPLLTGCQDDIDDTVEESASVYTYHLVADAAQDANASTRALEVDGLSKILSTWSDNDNIMTYVLDDNLNADNYSQITCATGGTATRFDGDISSKNAITTDKEIAFFYPGNAAVGNEKTITPATQTEEKTGGKVSGYYHDISDKTQQFVELNLTSQDGTAETIGKRFDYQWAKKKPENVNDKKIKVNIGKMKRIIAIWALRFTDENNQPLQNIDSIYISNMKGSDVLDLKTGELIQKNPEDESMNIVLNAGQNKTFTSVGGTYTYAALLPGTYNDVVIVAYVGNKRYKKVYASLTFEADKVYRSNILKMEEPKQEPFVLVQGIQWATGNFIHYQEGSQEFWGIAPAQWWISRRAVLLGSNRKEVSSGGTLQSSQFESSPTQTADDLDLFRYGSIAQALNITDIDRWIPGGDISQKISGGKGDIVWYYTKDKHKKYRMPTGTELKTLYETANAIPAYCYTDKKTIVYGAYFTTSNGTRINMFPTKVRTYHKYTNVTALVLANKGLFLPITGRRSDGISTIGFRDMAYRAGAYGQYMASTGGLAQADDFFFGPTEWNFSRNSKGQGRAIRPILVSDDKTADPVFPPFANIK